MLEQPAFHAELLNAQPLDAESEDGLVPPRQQPCAEKFQLPAALWRAVFACYATFIAALTIATGGSGPARLVLAVSGLFIFTYFTVATILARLGEADSFTVSPARPLQTIYGPVGSREVWAQVLLIPIALALFGLAVAVVVGVAGA